MLRNYFRIAFRTLLKNKMYSFINIAGLSIGLTCSFLLIFYMIGEYRYDNYISNAPSKYRLLLHDNESKEIYASTQYLLAPSLKQKIAGLEEIVRVRKNPDHPTMYKVQMDNKFQREENLFMADPGILKFYNWDLESGQIDGALEDPYSIVLSKESAARYFGNENPIDKIMTLKRRERLIDVKITGVLKQIPYNSHFSPDFIIPFELEEKAYENINRAVSVPSYEVWDFAYSTTYMTLPENISASQAENIIIETIKTHTEKNYSCSMQNIRDIYLESGMVIDEYSKKGNKEQLFFFAAVVVLILLIASFNFIMLSTARTAARTVEIGVRKVIGANRTNLIFQFMTESIILAFISMPIAFVSTLFILPVINQQLGTYLIMDFTKNLEVVILFPLLTLIVGLFAGSYVSIFLSRLTPIEIMLKKIMTGGGNPTIRRAMIVFQLSIFIGLVILTQIIVKQMEYVRSKDVLGYRTDNLLFLDYNSVKSNDFYKSFKNELLRNPNIENVSGSSSSLPDSPVMIQSFWFENGEKKSFLSEYSSIDYDYFETCSIEFLSGRSFSKDYSSDARTGIILNEEAAAVMGVTDKVGQNIKVIDETKKLIGITKTFACGTPNDKPHPAIYRIGTDYINQIVVRVKSANALGTLNYIKETWNKFSSDEALKLKFADKEIEFLYQSKIQFGKLIASSSIISIIIACLGLFGLSSFIAERRKKEIGIRKVFGASVIKLLLMLIKEFGGLVVISVVVSCPAAYFIAEKWLQDFTHQIKYGYDIFINAGLLALAITLLTVIWQSLKAAFANPVESLRSE